MAKLSVNIGIPKVSELVVRMLRTTGKQEGNVHVLVKGYIIQTVNIGVPKVSVLVVRIHILLASRKAMCTNWLCFIFQTVNIGVLIMSVLVVRSRKPD